MILDYEIVIVLLLLIFDDGEIFNEVVELSVVGFGGRENFSLFVGF